ncbi:putative flagellar hook-associated protein 2 [Oceanimonas sp. GK1]|uniref:flagellar filament capping protein FliD n=1 Tax=Oceanimonas sp. (strain GK1 / IBRC-M 10197) TaxID=511062 RepID=UPI0002495487|nr:flagellar filament capping protein FliD [Oceanimonas sp. GK1]AEY02442.1 putative flagellar hook-associated protein 2 [Oceanimonas sp. GK1]
MADLKLPGVGSGFPIQAFVDATVAGERAAKDQQLSRRADTIDVQLSSYGSIKSALDSFNSALKKLGDNGDFQKRSVTLDKDDYITARAGSSAVAGSYSIQVMQLAQAHKLGSDAVAADKALGSGSLTMQVGSESFTVNIDKEKSTLAEVAAAINNAEDNKGVRATVITDDLGSRLVYFSDKTGEDSKISVAASSNNDGEGGFSLNNLGTTYEIQAAKNAKVSIDGAVVTSQSNEIKDAIADVTFDLKKVNDATGSNPNTTLTIGYDKKAVEESIKEFVTAYNKVINVVDNLSEYNAVSEKAGPLNGDSTTRGLKSKMRDMLSEAVSGASGSMTSLNDFGVKTKKDGTLELDESVLKEQLTANFDEVGFLFSSESGISNKFNDLIDSYTGRDGVLTKRNESLNQQMRRLETDADKFEEYMAGFEARVYKQFSSMDMMVAKMNQQLNSVMAAFSNMPGMGDNQ